jgi:hypothetical protein
MGCARNIGRLGALAVALGVGYSLPPLTNNDKFAAPLNEFWDTTAKSGSGSLV